MISASRTFWLWNSHYTNSLTHNLGLEIYFHSILKIVKRRSSVHFRDTTQLIDIASSMFEMRKNFVWESRTMLPNNFIRHNNIHIFNNNFKHYYSVHESLIVIIKCVFINKVQLKWYYSECKMSIPWHSIIKFRAQFTSKTQLIVTL